MDTTTSTDVSTVPATQTPERRVRLCPHCSEPASDGNPINVRVYVDGEPHRFNGGKRAAEYHTLCAYFVAQAASGNVVVCTGKEWSERQKSNAPAPQPEAPPAPTQDTSSPAAEQPAKPTRKRGKHKAHGAQKRTTEGAKVPCHKCKEPVLATARRSVLVDGKPVREDELAANGTHPIAGYHQDCALAVAKEQPATEVLLRSELLERRRQAATEEDAKRVAERAKRVADHAAFLARKARREREKAEQTASAATEGETPEVAVPQQVKPGHRLPKREREEELREGRILAKRSKSRRKRDKSRKGKSSGSRANRETPAERRERELAAQEQAVLVELFRCRPGRTWKEDCDAFFLAARLRGGGLGIYEIGKVLNMDLTMRGGEKAALAQEGRVVLDDNGRIAAYVAEDGPDDDCPLDPDFNQIGDWVGRGARPALMAA